MRFCPCGIAGRRRRRAGRGSLPPGRSAGGPPGGIRWSSRVGADGSRIGRGDGVPGDATTPRTRGSRRAREHTGASGRARPLARPATLGRWCGRRSGTRPGCVTDAGVSVVRRRAPGPGRLRRRRGSAHGRWSVCRLGTGVSSIPAQPSARADRLLASPRNRDNSDGHRHANARSADRAQADGAGRRSYGVGRRSSARTWLRSQRSLDI